MEQKTYGISKGTRHKTIRRLSSYDFTTCFGLAMFGVMREPLLYIFFGDANAQVTQNFLWISDLSNRIPLYGLPLINAITQYLYLDMSNKDQADNPGSETNGNYEVYFPFDYILFRKIIFCKDLHFTGLVQMLWK